LATLIGATVGVLQCREVELEGARLWLLGRRRCAGPAVDVAGDPHQVERLWTRLVELGATPAGELALEWARLKAGLPRFMADYDQDSVVLEADDPALVSFSKGCYLGQEIVARVHYQGQPAQLVRCLHMDGNELPEPGDVVLLCADGGDKPVGHVTSAALVPGTGAIVLAMIKRRAFTPGTRVRIVRGGRELAATVAARETVRALRESA
jgi:folate-binding protein YgfZ